VRERDIGGRRQRDRERDEMWNCVMFDTNEMILFCVGVGVHAEDVTLLTGLVNIFIFS
jgi:hypothetical protein